MNFEKYTFMYVKAKKKKKKIGIINGEKFLILVR